MEAVAAERAYRSLREYLNDPAAPAHLSVPPGGPVSAHDDAHMAFLAATIRRTASRAARLDKLCRYAALIESIAPGDPCIRRVLDWHGELISQGKGE